MHVGKEGKFAQDVSDEITRETLVASGGDVVHTRVRAALGLPVDETASPERSA